MSFLKKKENLILILLLLGAFFLRFNNLGYSNFFGDETKTFYLDKTVSATNFFLDQRKGPIQFLVVWLVEKAVGKYDPLFTRLPFALSGSLALIALYLFTKKLFDVKTALFTLALFAFNGFFVGFSRTVQYQSVMLFFGFSGLYLFLKYFDTKRAVFLLLSALSLSLAVLSHYDALILLIFVFGYSFKMRDIIKNDFIKYFILPLLILPSLFYLPYLLNGYFSTNTLNYLGRRVIGLEYAHNMSLYTFWVYNPSPAWLVLLIPLATFFYKNNDWKIKILIAWFFIPFILFEMVFSNPGTHIHNYLLPLFILIGFSLGKAKNKFIQNAYILAVFCTFITSLYVYIPGINKGYPWKDSHIFIRPISKINKEFHLFLYGFVYNRGWNQISDYIRERGGVREVYTNDNDTIAKYYLNGISYSPPGPNFIPQFYIDVMDNQEFVLKEEIFTKKQLEKYVPEKEFFVDGNLVAVLYRLEN